MAEATIEAVLAEMASRRKKGWRAAEKAALAEMAKATIEAALAEMAEATIVASFLQRLTRERVHLTHVFSLRVNLASGGGGHCLDAASSRGGGNDRMLQPRVSWPANNAGSHDLDGGAALPTLQVRRSFAMEDNKTAAGRNRASADPLAPMPPPFFMVSTILW